MKIARNKTYIWSRWLTDNTFELPVELFKIFKYLVRHLSAASGASGIVIQTQLRSYNLNNIADINVNRLAFAKCRLLNLYNHISTDWKDDLQISLFNDLGDSFVSVELRNYK